MALPFLNKQAKRLDQIVAVDLGARQTKAVRLHQKNGVLTLHGYLIQDTPVAVHDHKDTEKGRTVEALGNHLKSLVKALGDQTRNVALVVGVSDCFLRHAEMPALPVSDLRQMFRLNGKAYLQQDYPDHVFDCCVLVPQAASAPTAEAGKPAAPAGPAKLKVLVAGMKRETLDNLKAASKHAGLVPCQIMPGMVTPANAFEVAEPEVFAKEAVALVDIGLKQTTITMLKKGELVMNRVVALGGERITAALAESLCISQAEAEGIKIGMPAEVQQHLESVITALGRELRASIDFYEHQQDVTVGQVLVSGGSSRCEFIVHTLQNEMMVPCKTWNPATKMLLDLPTEQRLMFEQAAPHLAVALGAAVAAF